MRVTLLLLACGLAACSPGRPGFPEPEWGSAPPPRTEEVTEITYDYRHCDKEKCTNVVVILNRAGGAVQEFYTREKHDSTRISRVDSLTFVEAVGVLQGAGFFSRTWDGSGKHPPFVVDSWLLSGATYCRRKVDGFGRSPESGPPIPPHITKLEGIIRGLSWHVPELKM